MKKNFLCFIFVLLNCIALGVLDELDERVSLIVIILAIIKNLSR